MKLEKLILKYPELNREIAEALVSKLNNEPYKSPRNGNGQKLSLAIAFANLMLEEEEDVTEHHKKMLRKYFTDKEIDSLSRFLSELNQINAA